MRILIIHNHYQDLGGEDTVFHQEALALQETDEVFTLTFTNKKGIKGLFQFLLSPWNIFAAQKVKRKIKEVNPDIIHFHNTQYACGPLAIRYAKKSGKALVMSLHNFRLLCPSATLFYRNNLFTDSINQNFPWTAVRNKVLDHSLLKTFWTAFSYWLHRKSGTWNLIDRYMVLAEFSRKLFISSTLPVDHNKFVVKPNFFDPITLTQTANREDHFLYIGRLSSEKGIINLIQAVSGTPVKLKIAGTGPQLPEVKEYIAHNSNLTYLGLLNKSEIAIELATCKALMVPSVCYEGGVPITILEAMSYYTPILASNIGAIPDIIKPGETGFLFDPQTAESVLDSIAQLNLLSEEQHKDLVQQAYRVYEGHFTRDIVIRKLRSEYQNLIAIKS